MVVSVVIAEGKRPDTFRTRKLSPPAPMVLHPGGCGRVGHRRTTTTATATHHGWPFRISEPDSATLFPRLHGVANLAHERRRVLRLPAREHRQDQGAVIGPAA